MKFAKLAALALATIGMATIAPTAEAQSTRGMGMFALDPVDDGNATLSITGQGMVPVSPDVAVFTAGVETTGATAEEALAANARATQSVIAALRREGIAARDIQTSRISLRPVMSEERDYPRASRMYEIRPPAASAMADAAAAVGAAAMEAEADAIEAAAEMDFQSRDESPRIVGYRAANMVSIRQRDLDGYGSLIDALVAAGANAVEGPIFELEESAAIDKQARDLAIADARREAEEYAAAAGLRVKRIMSVEQGQTSGLRSRSSAQFGFMEAMAYDMYEAPTPAKPGELRVTSSVGMLFELEPR